MATLDPIYLRRQAELCLAIAGLMSNAKVARQAADQYLRRAEQAEVAASG